MHHVEGAQCGLPVIYHKDGGGVVDMCRRYGVPFRNNLVGAIEEATRRIDELRMLVLENIPSGDRMVYDFAEIIQRLIVQSKRGGRNSQS